MRHGWTRSWGNISAAAALVTALSGAAHAAGSSAKRANEITLAGLRPGRDTASRAVGLYKTALHAGNSEMTWHAYCSKETLTVELDSEGKIQTVRASETRRLPGNCEQIAPVPWRTGLGLRIGDRAERVVQLYGAPDSRSPGTKGGQRLELFYYAFDWAGPEVPQVMEVVCSVGNDGAPGHVVEITLAASSL